MESQQGLCYHFLEAGLTQCHEKASPSTFDALLDPWASSLNRCAAASCSSRDRNFALLGVCGRKNIVTMPNKTVMIFVRQIRYMCSAGCRTYAFNNEDPGPASTKLAESGLGHGELYDCNHCTGSPQAQWRAVRRKHH